MRRARSAFPITYAHADGFVRRGEVRRAQRDSIDVAGPALSPGDVVTIARDNALPVLAQVNAVDGDGARCTPLEPVAGIRTGAPTCCDGGRLGAYVGAALLGHVLDAWGRCVDGARVPGRSIAPLDTRPIPPASRVPIERVLHTGVAAIDAFATLGHGQRVALAAGAGVGKTTLLRRIVENADVDARVVALVGERGRELEETVRRLRASPSWSSTSLYCATSETGALERFTAARSASAQAQRLCRDGRRILLVVDSLSRAATAWRELALAADEPLAARGYPPSLAAALAKLVEVAGARRDGSISAVYTVLVEGDDPTEPVTDAVRALLDGQISLSRRHADAARYPAIDVLRCLSRAMSDIVTSQHRADAEIVRHALATLENADDLLALGAYKSGNDAWLDTCVALRDSIENLIFDGAGMREDPVAVLAAIAVELRRAPRRSAGIA
ncbi:MAG TPA: EscN/YscN/HrcN family type III secretion system ATPase [Candidatus Eremiobacteraceae bacterium]|nr:EscN/YscN/HrcN family type III secretion system ATPase [Candidatus Eremiobacteraceae bacterium]